MSRNNPNAMTIQEYRNLKEMLKTQPINKNVAAGCGRGTTTLATIKKSRSFKHYHELRRLARGKKKKTVKQINAEPVQIPVAKSGRKKNIEVKQHEPILPEGATVVVPAALFETLSDQMTLVYDELVKFNSPVTYNQAPEFIATDKGEPVKPLVVTFKERFYAKVNEINRRWRKK